MIYIKKLCNIYVKNFTDKGPIIVKCTKRIKLVNDVNEQRVIIENYHLRKTNHRGICETLKKISELYHWKNMKETIASFINKCEICNKAKYNRQQPHPTLNFTDKVDKPFQKLYMDVFNARNQKFLTIIDAFTKFAQAIPIASKNAVDTADALITYFSLYGLPDEIICDQGTEFSNNIVKELLEKHKIQLNFCTPRNPNSNSLIERLHSILNENLRILQIADKETSITKLIKLAILAYNSTTHSTTTFAPVKLLFGHTNARDSFDMYYDQRVYSEYVEKHRTRLKHLYERIGQY